MTAEPEELAYKARALAQAHPLSPLATRYVNRAIGEQRTSQPVPEIGIWAGAGLIGGYSLRRVEEHEAGVILDGGQDADGDLDLLDQEAVRIAADLRTAATPHFLVDEERMVAALDRIIASEINRRLDHWRDTIEEQSWAEIEEYITWWVVKGYALRVAETAAGAVA